MNPKWVFLHGLPTLLPSVMWFSEIGSWMMEWIHRKYVYIMHFLNHALFCHGLIQWALSSMLAYIRWNQSISDLWHLRMLSSHCSATGQCWVWRQPGPVAVSDSAHPTSFFTVDGRGGGTGAAPVRPFHVLLQASTPGFCLLECYPGSWIRFRSDHLQVRWILRYNWLSLPPCAVTGVPLTWPIPFASSDPHHVSYIALPVAPAHLML